MAFTKKIAGWVAGRIKGEQARKDTMRWMEKTGLGQILDIAGDIALTQGAIKGVSGLKGLLTGQKAATAAQTAATATTAKALPEGVTEVGRLASASPAESRALVGQMMAPKPMPPLPAPGAPVGPVTPKIGMPQMPTSLPPAGGAAPTPIASQVSAGMRPPTPPTPAPTFAAAPRPALPPAPSPMRPLPAAGPATTTVGARIPGAVLPPITTAPMTPNEAPGLLRRTLGAVGRGAAAVGSFAKENPSLVQATATPIASVIGASMEQDIEERKLKLQEEQAKREQAARDRLAQLLMPMFQSQMGSVKPLNPPTFRG